MSVPEQKFDSPAALADALARSFDGLRHVLSLLRPAERDAPGLDGGWSAKVQLAHVAFWDDFQLRRMQAALAGESRQGFPRPEHDNDDQARADAQRDWDEVMAAAVDARRRMVDFARDLDPAVLAQEFPEGERMFSVGGQLRHMVRHVRGHTRPIMRYCGSMQRWQTKANLRAYLAENHARLRAGAERLPDAILHSVPVCGVWTIRDVLAHVLSWNEHADHLITHWPVPPAELVAEWPLELPMDAINERLMAARTHLRLAEIEAGLAHYHTRFLDAFDRASDADLSSVGQTWMGEEALSLQFFEVATHEAEHAAQLWAYRNAQSQ